MVESFPDVGYFHEPERGLNVARNRALRVARGDVVAFVDDDAIPEPEWLDGLMPNFQSPRVVCVTGLTLPIALDTRSVAEILAALQAAGALAEEIEALLAQRHLAQDQHHCPHGRPTALVFTREDLDRQFKRI